MGTLVKRKRVPACCRAQRRQAGSVGRMELSPNRRAGKCRFPFQFSPTSHPQGEVSLGHIAWLEAWMRLELYHFNPPLSQGGSKEGLGLL